MRRSTWACVVIGIGVAALSGIVLDVIGVLWHRFSFGAHLAIQVPAGIGAMLLAAWWVDRRRARIFCDVAGCDQRATLGMPPHFAVCEEHMTTEEVGRLLGER